MSECTAHPLTPERWDDLVAVFGGGAGRGDCGRCWCMWWRLPRKGLGMGDPATLKAAFHQVVLDGPPPGLIAYLGPEPAGWVQVGPRSSVPEWNPVKRITAPPDPGDVEDPGVWGISCFVVRTGYRRKGVSAVLLDAAIQYSRLQGARVLDACPVETSTKKTASALYHGVASAFQKRGFQEVARRRPDRPLLRLTLNA